MLLNIIKVILSGRFSESFLKLLNTSVAGPVFAGYVILTMVCAPSCSLFYHVVGYFTAIVRIHSIVKSKCNYERGFRFKKKLSPFLASYLIFTTLVSYSYLCFIVLFLGYVSSSLSRQTLSQRVKYEAS